LDLLPFVFDDDDDYLREREREGEVASQHVAVSEYYFNSEGRTKELGIALSYLYRFPRDDDVFVLPK
jgi:hypothetical protein